MRRRALTAAVCALLVTGSGAAGAQKTGPDGFSTLDRYQRGQRLVRAAVAALGGLDAARRARFVEIELVGEVTDHTQGTAPWASHAPLPIRALALYDFARSAMAYGLEREFLGGAVFDVRAILSGTGGTIINQAGRTHARLGAAGVGPWDTAFRHMPIVVLHRALRNIRTARWAGTADEGRSDVVHVTFGPHVYALHIDRQSQRLRAIDVPQSLGPDGDAVARYEFADYAPFGDVLFPRTIRHTQGGQPFIRFTTARVDWAPARPGARFEVPEDVRLVTPGPFAVDTLAAGVYLARGPRGLSGSPLHYDVPFVDLGDRVLIVDAPIQSGYVNAVRRTIAATLPGKPVAYLVATHFHYDHSSGARPVMAEGATIVTTPDNRPLFERLAAARPTLARDGLELDPDELAFDLVTERSVRLEGTARAVTVHRVGPTPHVDEMLMVVVPEAGVLLQADFLSDAFDSPMASELERIVKDLGLTVRLVAGIHSEPVPAAELWSDGS